MVRKETRMGVWRRGEEAQARKKEGRNERRIDVYGGEERSTAPPPNKQRIAKLNFQTPKLKRFRNHSEIIPE